tara:strand:+ start:15 stop:296 length:282 start_codon:yes stop_codon:yes gene_type:complete
LAHWNGLARAAIIPFSWIYERGITAIVLRNPLLPIPKTAYFGMSTSSSQPMAVFFFVYTTGIDVTIGTSRTWILDKSVGGLIQSNESDFPEAA